MRIHLFVRTLNDETGGGSHFNSLAYMRALAANGHTVTVHVFYQAGNHIPSDINAVVHEGFGRGHLGERAYLAELLANCEADADAFFLYAVEFAWGGGLYRKRGGKVPVLVYMDSYLASMRTTHERALSMQLYAWKRLLWDKTQGLEDARNVDRFLPCSPYIGGRYMQFGFPREKFTVLPNIVPNAAAPRKREAHEPLTALYVGRLVYVKGVDLALSALAAVREFGTKLLIVGDGPMRAELEEKAKALGIPLEITGWIPEPEVGNHFERADFFLHAARWPDPAPRTIVAAMQHGLPAIVPDTGGSAWIADAGGLVYQTGSVPALAGALRKLLSSETLREELAAGTRAQPARFTEDAVYPQLEDALHAVARTP